MKTITYKANKILKVLFALSLFILLFNHLSAHGVIGQELRYECTSTPGVYKVYLKVYKGCEGIEMCQGCRYTIPNGNVLNCILPSQINVVGLSTGFEGINYGSYTANAVSGTSGIDIVQTCPIVKSTCTNCNTRTAGTFDVGVEVYNYEATLDLSSIPSGCCKVRINSTIYNAIGVTTQISSELYNYAVIDRCLAICNSSPKFNVEPKFDICIGTDFAYNLGAIDPDGDSLSYAFGSAETYNQGLIRNIDYATGYSPSNPFPFFGSTNANAPSPAGLRINAQTGDVQFRPTATFGAHFVIDVTEWRLINGIWTNIGRNRRQTFLQAQTCETNKIPILKTYKNGVNQNGNQNFTAYAGVPFCIDIVAEDQQTISFNTSSADTTDLSMVNNLDNTLSNATFTKNYILNQRHLNGPKADSMKFCWTPPLSAIRSIPHSIIFNGNDRTCPLVSGFAKGLNIKVEAPKLTINSISQNAFCNHKTSIFNVNYTNNSIALLSNNVYTIQLSNENGLFSNSVNIGNINSITSTGIIQVILPSGLLLNKNYKIRLLSSSDVNAESAPINLNIVEGYTLPIINANNDSICNGSKAIISLNNTNSNLNYKWFLNNQIIANHNLPFIETSNTGIYKATVSNNVCTDTSNNINLVVLQNPVIGNINGNATPTSLNQPLNYNISNQTNVEYNWTVVNGIIQNGQGTNSINVIWPNVGNGKVKLKVFNNYNCVDSTELNTSITSVGIDEFNLNNSLMVYPNPTKNTIVITSKLNLTNKQFTISNIVGQIVLSGKLNNKETTLNLVDLPNGLYLLNMEGSLDKSIKIIKE